MNIKKNYNKGTRLDIIKTLHMNAVIPNKALVVMDTPRTYKDKLREMEKEGLIEEYRVKNWNRSYRIYTLKDYEKNKSDYIEKLGDGYYENYVMTGQQAARTCRSKTGSESMRIISAASTYIMMKQAGVKCDPNTKPNLYRNELLDECGSVYYTSREVKGYTDYHDDIKNNTDEMGDAMKQVISSRMTGLLLSDGGAYPIYHLGYSLSNWQRGGELKIKVHMDYMLGSKMSNPKSCDYSILTLEDYASLARVITPLTDNDEKNINAFRILDTAYKRIYAVPYSLEGRKMIEIMTIRDWEYKFKSLFLKNYEWRDVERTGIPCDGYTDDKYVLLFCIPDLKKLRLFKTYAARIGDKNRFAVLCFDFQEEMVAKACGSHCRILKASFDKFYDIVKKGGENK